MKKIQGKFNSIKVLYALGGLVLLFFLMMINPFGYNDLGYREIVETPTGQKYVVFTNGIYWKIPGSKVTTYPNVITISHRGTTTGSTIEGTQILIRFNDATEAYARPLFDFDYQTKRRI